MFAKYGVRVRLGCVSARGVGGAIRMIPNGMVLLLVYGAAAGETELPALRP